MSRQVDIKALISHIVRGDGADKCRICMGDTSEGQVYLGDTVMMDGERPITLAELLEIITGIEVPIEENLPLGLCTVCTTSAKTAGAFLTFCQKSADCWSSTLQLLTNLPAPEEVEQKSPIYAIITKDYLKIINGKLDDCQDADSESDLDKVKSKRNKFKKKQTQCPDCEKKFKYLQHLYHHLKDSPDYKRSCPSCGTIMLRDELIKHLKDFHNQQPYDCKKCPALFQSSKHLIRHLANAHASGEYTCGDCGRNFKNSKAFHGHLSMHIAKNCPSCDKLYRNHRCYMHHVKLCCNLDKTRDDTYRTKNKILFEVTNKSEKKVKVGVRGSADTECICDYCNKKFAGKKFVCAHIQIVHMKNTHKPCPYCGKLLAAAHLNVHIKKHEEVSTFTCEHCGILLKTKLGYVQHIRLHTGEKPYTCKYCPETFSASSRRSEHIRKAHKSAEQIVLNHACEFCPARFRLPYRLKKHLSSVHNDKDKDKLGFECPECHVKFSSCRGLLHHSRKHQSFSLKIKRGYKKNLLKDKISNIIYSKLCLA